MNKKNEKFPAYIDFERKEINLTFRAHPKSGRQPIIRITTVHNLSWQNLQALVEKGSTRDEKANLLFSYLIQDSSAEDIGFRGELTSRLSLKELSPHEQLEVRKYLEIFKNNNFVKHYEVNQYISNNNMWDDFPQIRSINTHESGAVIRGIKPKFFAVVCAELNLNNFAGSKLKEVAEY